MTIIDKKIVSPDYGHASSWVTYTLYKDERAVRRYIRIPKSLADLKNFGQKEPKWEEYRCFSGLPGMIKSFSANRLLYKVKPYIKGQGKEGLYSGDGYEYPLLTDEESMAWINLTKRYKMLPGYLTQKCGVTKLAAFYLDPKIPPSQFYMYVSIYRFLREHTGFIKSMLYLVNELGMNFYAAFVLVTKTCVRSTGHHLIDDNVKGGKWDQKARRYVYDDVDPNTVKIPLRRAFQLKRYCQNPSKYDRRKFSDNQSWNCANTIINVKVPGLVDMQIPGVHLLHPAIQKAILLSKDKEIEEQIKLYKKDEKIDEWLKNYKEAGNVLNVRNK